MAHDLNLDLSFEVEDELDETENSSSSSDEDEGDLGDVAENELQIEPMSVPVTTSRGPAARCRCNTNTSQIGSAQCMYNNSLTQSRNNFASVDQHAISQTTSHVDISPVYGIIRDMGV